MQIRIEAALEEGAIPPPLEGERDGRRQSQEDGQPTHSSTVRLGVMGSAGLGEQGCSGPHSSCSKSAPGDGRGSLHNVCPNSAWIPARAGKLSFSWVHQFHLQEPDLDNTGESVAFLPTSLSATTLWNHRKSLAVPAKNFWIKQIIHIWWIQSFFFLCLKIFMIFTGWFVVLDYAVSNVWLCSWSVAIWRSKASHVAVAMVLSSNVVCNQVIKPWMYICSLINTQSGRSNPHTFRSWFQMWPLKCWKTFPVNIYSRSQSIECLQRLIPRQA